MAFLERVKKLTSYIYSPTAPASEDAIRLQIDDSIQEVFDNVTNVLTSTTDGSSGMDNIGMTSIDGVMTTPQQSLEYLKGRVDDTTPTLGVNSIVDFGAIGDGITDNTTFIQNAIDNAATFGKSVYIPEGVFMISLPLHLPANTFIYGSGYKSVIKKNSTTFETIETEDINAIFVTEGAYITIENCELTGTSVSNNTYGIVYYENTNNVYMSRVRMTAFKKAFYDWKSLFIAKYDRVHCRSCEKAFVFDQNIPKTMMTFIGTWAENCGQAYELYRANYSSFINTGADWANYITGNPYGQGYGDQATSKGVYEINLCRGITMDGIGMENCFGNGAVRGVASNITIDGLTVYFLKSDYVPNYGSEPNWAIGVITTTEEKVSLNISNVFVDSFVNTPVETSYPTKKKVLVANNYSVGAYGEIGEDVLIVNSIFKPSVSVAKDGIFGGKNGENNCLYVPDIRRNFAFNDVLKINSREIYGEVQLSGTASNKLVIPTISQGSSNTVHLITIRGLDNASNSSVAKAFIAHISFNTLTSVTNVTVLNGSTTGITAVGNGTNLEVTLPYAYNAIRVDFDFISKNKNNVNILGTTLA